MSMSVGSSSNSFAYLQFLLRQSRTSSPATGQIETPTDAGPSTGATSSASANPSEGATAMSSNASPQFSPQTFETLLNLQVTENGDTVTYSGTTTGPNGNTVSHSGTTTADGDTVTHSGTTTGPNGNTVGHSGATTADGDTVTHSGTTTGPNGGIVTLTGVVS